MVGDEPQGRLPLKRAETLAVPEGGGGRRVVVAPVAASQSLKIGVKCCTAQQRFDHELPHDRVILEAHPSVFEVLVDITVLGPQVDYAFAWNAAVHNGADKCA